MKGRYGEETSMSSAAPIGVDGPYEGLIDFL
jgi:hypothetical protein